LPDIHIQGRSLRWPPLNAFWARTSRCDGAQAHPAATSEGVDDRCRRQCERMTQWIRRMTVAVVRPDELEVTGHAVAERRAEAAARVVNLMVRVPAPGRNGVSGVPRVASMASDWAGGDRLVRRGLVGVATVALPVAPRAERTGRARVVRLRAAAAGRRATRGARATGGARHRPVGAVATSAVRAAEAGPSVVTEPTGGTPATRMPVAPAIPATAVVAEADRNGRTCVPGGTTNVVVIPAGRVTEAGRGARIALAGVNSRSAATADVPGHLVDGTAARRPVVAGRTVVAVTGPCRRTRSAGTSPHLLPGCSAATTSQRCRRVSSSVSCRCRYGQS